MPFVFQGNNTTQSRNVGKGEYYGLEASVTAAVSSTLSVGGNYSYIHRKFTDPTNAAIRALGVPTHKLFAFADLAATPQFHLTPSVEVTGDRWTVTTNGARYYRTGRAALVNFGASYAVTSQVELTFNARNLFDRSFQLVDGYPEEGRTFQLAARLKL